MVDTLVPHLGVLDDVYDKWSSSWSDLTSKSTMEGFLEERLMDVTLAASRKSVCIGGNMGCLLVDFPSPEQLRKETDENRRSLLSCFLRDRILAASVNSSVFTSNRSDAHAEINALGSLIRNRKSSGISGVFTAFITMPPCKNCFMALSASGVERIVTRDKFVEPCILETAEKLKIEIRRIVWDGDLPVCETVVVKVADKKRPSGAELVELLAALPNGQSLEERQKEVERLREIRKEDRQAQKKRKQERHEKLGIRKGLKEEESEKSRAHQS